jgi:peroxiredoxin
VGVLIFLVLLGGVALLALQTRNDESSEEAAFCSDEVQFLTGPLQAGDRAPDFKLPDQKGGFVRLSDYREQSNVVLVFYPAAFTPV